MYSTMFSGMSTTTAREAGEASEASEASGARVGSEEFPGLVPAETMEGWDLLSTQTMLSISDTGCMTSAAFDYVMEDGEGECVAPRDAGARWLSKVNRRDICVCKEFALTIVHLLADAMVR